MMSDTPPPLIFQLVGSLICGGLGAWMFFCPTEFQQFELKNHSSFLDRPFRESSIYPRFLRFVGAVMIFAGVLSLITWASDLTNKLTTKPSMSAHIAAKKMEIP